MNTCDDIEEITVEDDEDYVEHEGVKYHDGDPRPLEALDERAKETALDWFCQGLDFDCLLQPGYCDHQHYKDMAAERGIEIDDWDWSIGSHNGSDYAIFSGRFDVPKWVAWKMSYYEHLATVHTTPRPIRARWGKTEVFTPDTTPPAWLLALETMIANDDKCITASISKSSGYSSGSMSVEYEWDVDDWDETVTEGVMAGATWGALVEIVDHLAGSIDSIMKDDCEEIADDACGAQQADYEWQTSMECFEETAEANEWRFDEDGHFAH